MADPRFFDRAGPFPLGRVASAAGAVLADGAPTDRSIGDVAALDRADATCLTYFDSARLKPALARTQAGAVVVRDVHRALVPPGAVAVVATEPLRAFALAARLFYPEAGRGATSIDPNAHVHVEARLGDGVQIGAGVVIEAGAEIGDGTVIAANAVVGRRCIVGEDCAIGAGASLAYALVGARTIIHAGARVGQDGFGFALGVEHGKVPQLGRVLIGDDVEIGANSTIDRGALGDTVIGSGTKIDNLVQIAHNVVLGEHCVVVAQSGISGSTELGQHVVVAAQCGIIGHLLIGAGARLAARTAVTHDLAGNADYGGLPAVPVGEWRRQLVGIRRLGKTARTKE